MLTTYLVDLLIVTTLIIGLTAFLGSITNGFASVIFGRNKGSLFVEKSAKIQAGWGAVGGKKKKTIM